MGTINVYNHTEGCSVLLEYYGTPSAVVAMVPLAIQAAVLGDLSLALLAHQSVQGILDAALAGLLVSGVQLLPVRTVQTDVNGFAHAVVPLASLISAGDTLRVVATEIG